MLSLYQLILTYCGGTKNMECDPDMQSVDFGGIVPLVLDPATIIEIITWKENNIQFNHNELGETNHIS